MAGSPFGGSSAKKRQEMEELNRQIQDLFAEVASRDRTIQALKGDLSRAEDRASRSDDEALRELQQELQHKREEVDSLRARMKITGTDPEHIPAEVARLQRALQMAKAKLIEQQQMLQQLTARPLPYATVLEVVSEEKRVKFDPKQYEYKPGDFLKPGVRVRINPDSEFIRQAQGYDGYVHSRLEDERYGWVWVVWDHQDTPSRFYRIGRPDVDSGQRDLLLVEIEDREEEDKVIPSKVVILMENRRLEVEYPTDIDVSQLTPGASVKVNSETMQIVDVVDNQDAGEVAIVRYLVDERTCEVEHNGVPRLVYTGVAGESGEELEKGDRVSLDPTFQVIIRNLGKDSEQFIVQSEVNVTWDDIGGLHEAKAQMQEAIESPYKHPDIYRFYGKKPLKGVLLEGPPGNGKTMLAKAAARSLMDIYGTEGVPTGFIYVKGPEILNPYVGVIEQTIRQLFVRARKHKAQHGFPAVIFIDEAESILYRRGAGRSSDIERTTVPMFLAEMDGLDESGAIVILATNRADQLDPAVVRDGRVDRKIHIPRPDRATAQHIFRLHLAGKPLNNGYSVDDLTEAAVRELFSQERAYYDVKLNGPRKGTVLPFTLAHVSSGAMIAGIVDRATSLAMNRDIEQGTMTGMRPHDLLQAIEQAFVENAKLNHEEAMADFTEEFRGDVEAIQPRLQGGRHAA